MADALTELLRTGARELLNDGSLPVVLNYARTVQGECGSTY